MRKPVHGIRTSSVNPGLAVVDDLLPRHPILTFVEKRRGRSQDRSLCPDGNERVKVKPELAPAGPALERPRFPQRVLLPRPHLARQRNGEALEFDGRRAERLEGKASCA